MNNPQLALAFEDNKLVPLYKGTPTETTDAPEFQLENICFFFAVSSNDPVNGLIYMKTDKGNFIRYYQSNYFKGQWSVEEYLFTEEYFNQLGTEIFKWFASHEPIFGGSSSLIEFSKNAGHEIKENGELNGTLKAPVYKTVLLIALPVAAVAAGVTAFVVIRKKKSNKEITA